MNLKKIEANRSKGSKVMIGYAHKHIGERKNTEQGGGGLYSESLSPLPLLAKNTPT